MAFLVFVRMKVHSKTMGKGKETRIRKKGESCKRGDDTMGEESFMPSTSARTKSSGPKICLAELFACVAHVMLLN